MIQSAGFPLITVVVPAYNHEQYICMALESVRQQTYTKIEIVIIDDGSTDATADGILEWMEQHQKEVKVIFRKRENRGLTCRSSDLI